MYHFIYKTYSDSGKYYIGRHSTNNIDDGYKGSGKWVRNIKNKNSLKREIIMYVDSFENLLKEEEKLLNVVINDPLNMNFNNNPVGYATGDLNPAKSEKERKRKKENNWMKTEEGRRWFSENNPSKTSSVKEKRRQKALEQLSNGSHNFLNIDVQKRKINASIEILRSNNPMWNLKTRQKVSDSLKNRPLPKLTCPHCGKVGGGHANMYRWHFDNCKANVISKDLNV